MDNEYYYARGNYNPQARWRSKPVSYTHLAKRYGVHRKTMENWINDFGKNPDNADTLIDFIIWLTRKKHKLPIDIHTRQRDNLTHDTVSR